MGTLTFGSTRSPASTSEATSRRSAHTATSTHRATHTHVVGLGGRFLDVHLLAGDGLLGRLEQFVHHLLGVEGDEAEALALVLLFVEWHLDFDDLQRNGRPKDKLVHVAPGGKVYVVGVGMRQKVCA